MEDDKQGFTMKPGKAGELYYPPILDADGNQMEIHSKSDCVKCFGKGWMKKIKKGTIRFKPCQKCNKDICPKCFNTGVFYQT